VSGRLDEVPLEERVKSVPYRLDLAAADTAAAAFPKNPYKRILSRSARVHGRAQQCEQTAYAGARSR
jgi:hypothetical protein